MLAFAAYFIILSYLQFRHSGTLNNLLNLGFHFLVVINFIVDLQTTNVFESGKTDYTIPIASTVITLSYFMLILHLRQFEAFAVFINLIYYAVKDTFSFVVLVFITLSAFANALFVLSMIEEPDTSYDKLSGPNIFAAIMAASKGGIYYKKYEVTMQWPYVWAVYDGLFGFFVTTILLKTLVSILEHIHAHVAGLYKSERLKSKCRLMTENAYIFRRS
jgi:hypothetical protein